MRCVVVEMFGGIRRIGGWVVMFCPPDVSGAVGFTDVLFSTRAGAFVDDARSMVNAIFQREE